LDVQEKLHAQTIVLSSQFILTQRRKDAETQRGEGIFWGGAERLSSSSIYFNDLFIAISNVVFPIIKFAFSLRLCGFAALH
jgi:hypothetical protein